MKVGQEYNPRALFISAIVPKWLVKQRGISAGAKLAYGLLMDASDRHTGLSNITAEELAEELGVSVRQARNYLAELVDTHLIQQKHRGGGGVCSSYAFVWHAWAEGAALRKGAEERMKNPSGYAPERVNDPSSFAGERVNDPSAQRVKDRSPIPYIPGLNTQEVDAEYENQPPAPAKVEQCGSFQVQVFEPVATTAPTPPQRQPVPLEASNRRCEPDPREEPKAVTLGKACDKAIFDYCDKAGYLKWIDRLKAYTVKFRDERGIPEAVLIGLLPKAAERGRLLWSEHDHGQHGPRPIFLNRLEEGLADAVNLWQQEQRAEANRREAAEKARKREAAPAVDHAEEFRRHMDALVEAGPGSPEWEAITSKTERDIVRQRYRQRHPDQWVAYLERQAAQMQAQRAGAHS